MPQDTNLWSDKDFRQKCWSQSNQASIDSGTKAVSSLFLLNGAAATTLFAQAELGLKGPAIVFAFAALLAISALGLAHYYNSLIAQSFSFWPQSADRDTPYIYSGYKTKFYSDNDLDRRRLWLIMWSTLSGLMFLLGLGMVAWQW